MIGVHDPEGAEVRALQRLVDFAGKSVLEVGCGEGRMTWRFADAAASVLAFDPDEAAIASAREQTPESLRGKVEFQVGGMADIDIPVAAYDIAMFSWSI